MSSSASYSRSDKYQRIVLSLQLSQTGVHFLVKFRHGTCMYQKQQQEKPLSVTDIFRHGTYMYRKQQQEKPLSVTDIFRRESEMSFNAYVSTKRRATSSTRLTRLVGLVVKASATGAEDPGFESRCAEIFPGSSHTSDLKPHWLPCQAPGVIGSVLGRVGPVSIYCDWVKWKVWSAASVSV